MAESATILIVSDIHYASAPEKSRLDYECKAIDNPLLRLVIRCYRHFVWLRDPFAHNHLLSALLSPPITPDLVVANGDYSCDTGFIGVADSAARQSVDECLTKLRTRYAPNFHAIFGDHELGKITLAGGKGGLRLASWDIAQAELGLKPFWQQEIGKHLLVGVTSTLLAFPTYEREALPNEVPRWRELANDHWNQLRRTLAAMKPDQRLLLFCHDPTALPYLYEDSAVRNRLPQLDRTVIGHLHSDLLVRQSRILAGIPTITFLGAGIRRITSALNRAREWRHFKLLLCPSPAGIELTRNGGFYSARIDLTGKTDAEFTRHKVPRTPPPNAEPCP